MEKKQKLCFVKDVDADKGLIRGYVSTFEWDRDGDRFVKGAWELDAYKKNPVVLWGHRHGDLPIGKNVDMVEDDIGLFGVTEMDLESEEGRRITSLYARGFLNAFSVGFMVKQYKVEDRGDGQKGLAFTQAELYEYSAVSVPANPGALVSREVAEIAMKTLGAGAIEVLQTKSAGDKFLVVPISRDPANSDPISKDTPPDPANADGFGTALKGIIEMARIAKGSQLTEDKRSLISVSMSVFNELLAEHHGHVNSEDMAKLGESMKQFASAMQGLYPKAAEQIGRTISQIDKAVTGPAE